MRVASYNHMFGCNGHSLFAFLYVHGLYRLKKYKKIKPWTQIDRTIETITECNADVIAVSEVLGESQAHSLIEKLKVQGYSDFHVGIPHVNNPDSTESVCTLIATRIPSTTFFTPSFNVANRFGNGSGITGIFIESKNTYIIQVHLPLSRGITHKLFRLQLACVIEEIERIKKEHPHSKIIVMGDFNCTYERLVSEGPELAKLTRLSSPTPTCLENAFLKLFYYKDLDHILGFGVHAKNAGTVKGKSDHSLVWAEIS